VIDNELKKEAYDRRRLCKILLLGAAEAGKTTVLRQMRLIHKGQYTHDELMMAQPSIYYHIHSITGRVCQLLEGEESIDDKVTTLVEIARKYLKVIFPHQRPTGHILGPLLSDERVQAAVLTWGHKYYMYDQAIHFMSSIYRISSDLYIPTTQDMLNVRVPTSGIHVNEFQIKQQVLQVVDVGGQRNERRKWIHCFDDVTAVIFIVSLSDFDQVLSGTPQVNRWMDALQLFGSIMNLDALKNASIILFFNKTDIFSRKLRQGRSLQDLYPTYNGSTTQHALAFMASQFLTIRQTLPHRTIYSHFTCATDTTAMTKIINDVETSIINRMLQVSGLM